MEQPIQFAVTHSFLADDPDTRQEVYVASDGLKYSGTIPDNGISWNNLVNSQNNTVKIMDLFQKCMDYNSKPDLHHKYAYERTFFAAYFHYLKNHDIDTIPALLPQVLIPELNRRVDFMMIINPYTKIVFEIDGIQHYGNMMANSVEADKSKYAKTMKETRDLILAGYNVYRFGTAELPCQTRQEINTTIQTISFFFDQLFYFYQIKHTQSYFPFKYFDQTNFLQDSNEFLDQLFTRSQDLIDILKQFPYF